MLPWLWQPVRISLLQVTLNKIGKQSRHHEDRWTSEAGIVDLGLESVRQYAAQFVMDHSKRYLDQ
jgi:hypothetical protein